MAGSGVDNCSLLEPFKLSGVSPTGKILGQGAYARVMELTYRNLKCAGKKILPELTGYSNEEQVGVLKRAREECVTLSKIKHPNIVQFLGVYFEDESPLPILVMEFVPFTLTRHIEENRSAIYPVLTYSVLSDVAKALCYLHGGDPVIIHRDLTSNNVLLTYDMTAKVSDLGTAKMLNMSASKTLQNFNKMSRCPGTPAYMPPEAQYNDTDYDETLDCFSYGVLILHILCGEWPIPDNDHTRVLSEIERRQKYIKNVKDCRLMGLIKKCLGSKHQRPSAKGILEEVQRVQQSFGPQPTKMTLLDQVKLDADTKANMTKEISKLKDEQSKLKTEIKRLENLLFMERQETTAVKEFFEMRIHDLKSEVASRDSDKKCLDGRLQSEIKKWHKMEEEKEELKRQRNEDISTIRKLANEEIKRKEEEMLIYQQQKDQELDSYKRQKDCELKAKEREINHYKENLLEKEKIVNDIKTRNEDQARKAHNDLHTYESQKGRIIEHLRSGTQMHPLHHHIKPLNWRKGPDLRLGMTAPQYVVIKSTLYVGGGQTTDDESSFRHHIFKYSPLDDGRNKWQCPFPPCPTKYFGLGELKEKVVVVGGECDAQDHQIFITGDVFVLDESNVWRSDIIPAMTTPRTRSCVVSFKGCIAACGGMVNSNNDSRSKKCSSAVEIYRSGDREWFAVNSLPKPRAALRVSIIHETAYFLGGYYPSLSSPGEADCVCIELENLFQSNKGAQRCWNGKFKETPYKSSTPANLCGSLLAIGGVIEDQMPHQHMDTIYAYSPVVKEWHLIDKLPVQLSSATAITLSSGELMVLGGKTSRGRSASIYIGSLE